MQQFVQGEVALDRGDYDEARRRYTESLAMFRKIDGDSPLHSAPLLGLGRIASVEKDYVQARAFVEEALAMRRKDTENRFAIAIALNSLGEVDRCEGLASQATPLFEEALRYGREFDDSPLISWSLHNLGHVALGAGDLPTAAARFHESLTLRRRGGPHFNLASSFAAFASLALRTEAFADSARLFAATEAMLAAVHSVLAPADEQIRTADLAVVRDQLGDAAFAAARTEGRGAELEAVYRITDRLGQDLLRRPRAAAPPVS